MAADPIRQHVADRIAADGWGPFEALGWAKDRDKVSVIREVYALYRLCADETARADPLHGMLHSGHRLTGCVGWAYVEATGRSLGLKPERVKRITDHMDQESRAVEALAGAGSE